MTVKLRRPKRDECEWMVILYDSDGCEADFFETESAARECVATGNYSTAASHRDCSVYVARIVAQKGSEDGEG